MTATAITPAAGARADGAPATPATQTDSRNPVLVALGRFLCLCAVAIPITVAVAPSASAGDRESAAISKGAVGNTKAR